MTNFLKRGITGILFVLIVIGSILFNAYSFFAVTVLVSLLSIMEFTNLLENKYNKINKFNTLSLALAIHILVFLVANQFVHLKYLLLILPFVWIPFIYELFKGAPHPFRSIALATLSAIYIALPLSCLYLLGFVNGAYDGTLILSFFILVWSNDTGAYIVGVSIGKHKLYERISPKKTWEGFIGGILFTFVAAYIIWSNTGFQSLALWLVSGLIVGIFGTMGDLVESMLKRDVDAKDSGTILPGHGGMLDRFDAVLFSAPLILVLFLLFS